jgi:hypothetical protein
MILSSSFLSLSFFNLLLLIFYSSFISTLPFLRLCFPSTILYLHIFSFLFYFLLYSLFSLFHFFLPSAILPFHSFHLSFLISSTPFQSFIPPIFYISLLSCYEPQ